MTSRTTTLGTLATLGLMLGTSQVAAQGSPSAAVRATLPPRVEAPKSVAPTR